MCWVTAKFQVDIKFPGYSDMHGDIQLFIFKGPIATLHCDVPTEKVIFNGK